MLVKEPVATGSITSIKLILEKAVRYVGFGTGKLPAGGCRAPYAFYVTPTELVTAIMRGLIFHDGPFPAGH